MTSKQKGTTRRMYLEHERIRQQHLAELCACAEAEFPLNAKVKWIRTYDREGKPQYLTGKVVSRGEYSWRLKTDSGATHSRYPYELEHADE